MARLAVDLVSGLVGVAAILRQGLLNRPYNTEAVRAGTDTGSPRRAELLEEIRKAQEKHADARRDWAADVIDKEDWLDIRQRADERIARARKEYDRLSGTATVLGDIPFRHGQLHHRPDTVRLAVLALQSDGFTDRPTNVA